MQPDPGEAAISGDLSLQSHVLFQTESCPSKGVCSPWKSLRLRSSGVQ